MTAGYAQNDTPSQSGEPAESTVEKPVKPEKNYKPLVVRDRLVFDIYHSFWMGTPSQGDFLKFDPGFNVSAMWDFILPQAKSLSFGLGLGFTYYTQYSDCMFKYNRSKDISQYYILPEDLEYKHSRLAYMNVNIPIEIRYRHPCGFKIDVGVHAGRSRSIRRAPAVASRRRGTSRRASSRRPSAARPPRCGCMRLTMR